MKRKEPGHRKNKFLHSMKTKDLRLQVFGALSLGQQIPVFRSIVLPSSGSSIPKHIYTFPMGL
jgi:hypothetical protein